MSNDVAFAGTDGITDGGHGGATGSVPPGRRWNLLIAHLVQAYEALQMSWNPYENLPPAASFSLTGNDLAEGHKLAMPQVRGIFGASGQDVSPQLSWSGSGRDEELRGDHVRPGSARRPRTRGRI